MPQPTGAGGKTRATKPSKPTVQTRLNDVSQALNQVYRDTSKWNAVCLPLLGTLLFLFAVALIIIGATEDIEDLFIIGAIFIFGSLIFFFLLYLNVCRPMCKRNQVSHEYYDDHRGEDVIEPVRFPEQMPDYGHFSDDEDNLQATNKPVPTESQLYGAYKSRSFLATPATTKDVTLMEEEMSTPPPPRVKFALHRMASPPPKPSLPDEYSARNTPVSFSTTIDERVSRLENQDMELI